VAAAGHPFAELPAVPVQALADEPFVHYDTGNGLAIWVDQLAADHQVVLDAVLRTRSPRTAVQLAAAGMGVTIAPVSALPTRPTGTVRRLQPVVEREIVAVVAAPSDTLVHLFVADIYRRGIPTWAGPN
jgi:DNA-binding transcriptional LysR family regulator